MSDQLDKKSILEMSMGAILERVDYEMGKVMDNILDPNTKATAKRKISVTLELIPSADRRTITVQSTAKCSLTPTDPVTTSLYITNAPSTGELLVAEMVPQVPGQLALDGEEQDHPQNFEVQTPGIMPRSERSIHHAERICPVPRVPQGQQDLRHPRRHLL